MTMEKPAVSVRIRRGWRLFRTQQPRGIQALAGVISLLLVADVLTAAATGSSPRAASAQAGHVSAGGALGTVGAGGTGGAGQSSTTGPAGSAAGGQGPGGGTATGAGQAGGPGATGGTTGAGPASTAGGPLLSLGHGVTASSIRVVFPYADLGAVSQVVGIYGSSEDNVLSIRAAVNAINDAGGINGRKIDPEIVSFNPLDDASMRADCIKWTQDEHVFAVVDSNAWHDDHQLCITQENHTPLISSWTTVTDWTNRGNPNLWWTGPDAREVLDNLVAWVVGRHSLGPGIKFGVVAADRESDNLAVGYLDRSLANVGLRPNGTGSMHFALA